MEKTAKMVLALLIIIILTAVVIYATLPYLNYFFGALILYIIFRPLHHFFVRRIRIQNQFAAALVIIVSIFVVLIPLFFLMGIIVGEIQQLLHNEASIIVSIQSGGQFLNHYLSQLNISTGVIQTKIQETAMGFSLTVQQILVSLRNTKLVIFSIVANFIFVPLLSLAILLIFPLSEGLSIGLFLLGTSAGDPFIPKLAQVAKGDIAFAVGLMVLLMVVTIIYVPIVLPLLLSGVTVNPWDIAKSLILLMLLPLVIALFIRARYKEVANGLLPLMTQATNLSLLVLFVAFFVVYFSDLVNVIGTTAVMVAVVFVLVSFVIGYVLGGSSRPIRRVLALGTAQRNLSAALAIATLNFTDPDVMVMIMVVALAGLILLMFIGGEIGKRAEMPEEETKKQENFSLALGK